MKSTPEQAQWGWDIVGHERAIALLRGVLRSGHPPHAYLFTGPEGTGKRTLAVAFAMALNCQAEAPDGMAWPDQPCGLCSACSKVARGSHPDVVEINLQTQAAAEGTRGKTGSAKELKIDAIRELQAGVGLSPHSGRWKIYIIGDADRMNEEASNCLLKTLEEPPDHTILMLLASDESALLPTISSRCFAVPLRTSARTSVANALQDRWGAEEEQAELLAALSGGRVGSAVEMLGDRESLARRKRALEELTLLSGAPISERINVATKLAKMFTDARAELYEMLDAWEGWWRDVLLVSASASELAGNVDQMPTLNSVARKYGVQKAAGAIQLIHATRRELLENVNPRLALEALALGLP
jgi:DNA polymerase III subunit delta'